VFLVLAGHTLDHCIHHRLPQDINMLSLRGCALAGLLLLCVVLQGQAQSRTSGTDAATLVLQFDNR
jgi:hypothetical protein